jgi:hypothetical protein
MHPYGRLDAATYRLIGAAFSELEQKEPWLDGVTNVADVALLSLQAVNAFTGVSSRERNDLPDVGAARMLLEGHYLFDVVDCESDFAPYKVLILPDSVRLSGALLQKVRGYVAGGGQVLATGESGLHQNQMEFALDFGVEAEAENPFRPDYFRPNFELPSLFNAAVIFYEAGIRLRAADGQVMGWREDPFFNRTAEHFCSHQHTPNDPATASPGMVRGKHGAYIAWKIFSDYAVKGSIYLKWAFMHALDELLAGRKALTTSLPAQGITTVQRQQAQNRLVHHLLYAAPVRRGEKIEVIEDIPPIFDIRCSLRVPSRPANVYLAPDPTPLDWTYADGVVHYTVPCVECHQMVVLEL